MRAAALEPPEGARRRCPMRAEDGQGTDRRGRTRGVRGVNVLRDRDLPNKHSRHATRSEIGRLAATKRCRKPQLLVPIRVDYDRLETTRSSPSVFSDVKVRRIRLTVDRGA
jgi:hypothetical protein